MPQVSIGGLRSANPPYALLRLPSPLLRLPRGCGRSPTLRARVGRFASRNAAPVDDATNLRLDDHVITTRARRTRVFSHLMIGSNDLARSKAFYDGLFSAMGAKPGAMDAKGRLIYTHRGGRFMVSKPIDGEPAHHANGGTIGFLMDSPAEVDAWHKAGVEKGGAPLYAGYVCLRLGAPFHHGCDS